VGCLMLAVGARSLVIAYAAERLRRFSCPSASPTSRPFFGTGPKSGQDAGLEETSELARREVAAANVRLVADRGDGAGRLVVLGGDQAQMPARGEHAPERGQRRITPREPLARAMVTVSRLTRSWLRRRGLGTGDHPSANAEGVHAPLPDAVTRQERPSEIWGESG
jgi:hypothetical protein